MKRSQVFRNTLLFGGLFFLSAAGPVFAEKMPPTPRPGLDATPVSVLPDGVVMDPTGKEHGDETKAFFKRISGLYYDFSKLGVKEFSCRVDDNGWDGVLTLIGIQEGLRRMDRGENGELGSNAVIKSLSKMKFSLTYTKEKGFLCSREDFIRSGDKVYDELADKVSTNVETEMNLFIGLWSKLMGLEKIQKGQIGFIHKDPKGFILSEIVGDKTTVWVFKDDGMVTEAWMPSPVKNWGKLHLHLSFQKTTEGYLPGVIAYQTGNGEISGEIRVDYGDVGNFKMPRKIVLKIETPDEKSDDRKTTEDSFVFFNYRINGVPLESPLIRQPLIDPFNMLGRAFNESIHVGMEYHVGFGPFLSSSPQITDDYSGYNGSFGIGFEFTREFSLSAELQGADYKNKKNDYDLYFTEIMFLGKYRLLTGDFRPYLTGGLGVALSAYFPDKIFPKNIEYDVNFVAEAGAGVEVRLSKYFFLYAQTSYVDHLISEPFSQRSGMENPFHFVPLQFGVSFER